MNHDPLDPLRAEIAGLDRELVGLLARRASLARAVGAAKAERGLPIRDYGTEKRVIDRVRAACRDTGVDEATGEAVAREVIRGAIRVQEEFHGSIPAGTLHDVLVVGGAGTLGAWLCRFLANQGHRVRVCDPSGAPEGFASADLSEAADADIVVLATPLDVSGAVLSEVVALGPRGLVFDVASLKAPLADALDAARRAGVRVTSLHPMFGPGVRMLSGRSVLVCDCGDAAAMDEAEALFSDTALTVRRIPLEEHDRLMAVVLGLSHALAVVGVTAFRGMGIGLDELMDGASTTFLKLARTLAEVARENPDLYHEIQHANPATPDVYRTLESALEAVRHASLSGDPAAFHDLMSEGRDFFADLDPDRLPE